MFNPYDIAAANFNLLVNLADYLRRELLPEAPATEDVGEPYTPPFEGGQCEILYTVVTRREATFLIDGQPFFVEQTIPSLLGAIGGFNKIGNAWYLQTGSGNLGLYTEGVQIKEGTTPVILSVTPESGVDECGDIPNPNPNPSINSDGIANSSPPDIASDDSLTLGSPLVVIPPLGAALSAIAAAVAAAANALDAAKKIMDAIEVIGDVLDKIKDWLDDKDKDDDTKKSLYVHNYGSIRKDGFLRLYPSGEYSGFSPKYIDLQLLSVPIGYGRYFGNLSPNFYRFKSLGHISFVSATFGVLETHEIEFSRTSLTVPPNAFGFFYHLGLEDAIRANASLFYLKNPDDEE